MADRIEAFAIELIASQAYEATRAPSDPSWSGLGEAERERLRRFLRLGTEFTRVRLREEARRLENARFSLKLETLIGRLDELLVDEERRG